MKNTIRKMLNSEKFGLILIGKTPIKIENKIKKQYGQHVETDKAVKRWENGGKQALNKALAKYIVASASQKAFFREWENAEKHGHKNIFIRDFRN